MPFYGRFKDLNSLLRDTKKLERFCLFMSWKKANDQDFLVYPIVFAYRQHLELRFKEIICEGYKLLGDSRSYTKTHKLNKLWSEASDIINQIWAGHGTEEIEFIDHVVGEMCKLDLESDAFRFPDGKNLLPELGHINIRYFSQMMSRVSEFLYGVSAVICDMNEKR
jgi:hypothetical protein